jgi:hypothetical protein
VPLVELAKISCHDFNGTNYTLIEDRLAVIFFNDRNEQVEFAFTATLKGFGVYNYEASENYLCRNQLALFQYLFSRRINIFDMEAIDPRSLDINPYNV